MTEANPCIPAQHPACEGGPDSNDGNNVRGGGGSNNASAIISSRGLQQVQSILATNIPLLNSVTGFWDEIGDNRLNAVIISYLQENVGVGVKQKHFEYMRQFPAYFAALQAAGFPPLTSSEWLDIAEDKISLSGQATFMNFTNQDLANLFRIIPEDIGNRNPLRVPFNSINTDMDGFFSRGWDEQHYWFKVSAGGEVIVEKSNNQQGFEITGTSENTLMKWIAARRGKYYCVCWQPRSAERPGGQSNINPF